MKPELDEALHVTANLRKYKGQRKHAKQYDRDAITKIRAVGNYRSNSSVSSINKERESYDLHK